MSGAIATTPCAEVPDGAHCLEENGVLIGLLQDIIEPDGEHFVLANIDGSLLEVPESLAARLWELMGQRVIIGLFGGKYRAEASSL